MNTHGFAHACVMCRGSLRYSESAQALLHDLLYIIFFCSAIVFLHFVYFYYFLFLIFIGRILMYPKHRGIAAGSKHQHTDHGAGCHSLSTVTVSPLRSVTRTCVPVGISSFELVTAVSSRSCPCTVIMIFPLPLPLGGIGT